MSTAPLAEQLRLLDVADLDTLLRQGAHKARTLPEIAELRELDERHRRLTDDAARARTTVSDLERAVRKAEADVEQVRTRVARDTERLNSGQSSAKDLAGLQHELGSLATRQSDLEDVELEVMEQLETAQSELDALTGRLGETETQTEATTARRDQALADLRTEEDTVQARRAELVAGLDAGLLALYERVRDTGGGVAAARLVGNRCGGCRVEFAAADLAGIKRAAPEDVVQCEECRCILVREP